MIVVDTSAWVEFLRAKPSPTAREVERLIEGSDEIAVTEIVVMEVLAGARSAQHLRALRSRLLAFPVLDLHGLVDFEEAALLYRACRSEGETVNSMTDCLIAVPALREGAAILHNDSDFDVIARHSELKIHAPRQSR